MFESAELGHKIDKETYDKEVPALREALLDAQMDMAKLAKFPVIILIGGVTVPDAEKPSICSTNGWTRVICKRTAWATHRMKSSIVR